MTEPKLLRPITVMELVVLLQKAIQEKPEVTDALVVLDGCDCSETCCGISRDIWIGSWVRKGTPHISLLRTDQHQEGDADVVTPEPA